MINKQQVAIVSSNAGNVNRILGTYLDANIFTTFNQFEEYIAQNPLDVSDVIISGQELPYSTKNIETLINLVNLSYVFIDNKVYYLVTEQGIKDKVDLILEKNNITKVESLLVESFYEETLIDVLKGKVYAQRQTVTEIKTYRIKLSEFNEQAKKLALEANADALFETEEEILSEVSDAQPNLILASSRENSIISVFIHSDSSRIASLWAILKAQYFAVTSKVVLLENDIEFHTMHDTLAKSGIKYDYFDIEDLYKDSYKFIEDLRASKRNIVLVGSIRRLIYDYETIYNILYHNLEYDYDYIIKTGTLLTANPVVKSDIVMESEVPTILRSAENLIYSDKFKYIGLQTNRVLSSALNVLEFRNLLKRLVKANEIDAEVLRLSGITLREGVEIGGLFM